MTEMDKFKAYEQKRDFSKTPEPKASSGKSSKQPIFVVQQHDASRMHFDTKIGAGKPSRKWQTPRGVGNFPYRRRIDPYRADIIKMERSDIHKYLIRSLVAWNILPPGGETITGFWLEVRNRKTRIWDEHRDINRLMPATRPMPEGYL